MTGRQRRVGRGVLAGAVFAGCGWWVGRSGYEAAGVVLGVWAGAVVWAGAWRAGALPRPQPPRPGPAGARGGGRGR